jgi:Protein of unknown function (DUF1674)
MSRLLQPRLILSSRRLFSTSSVRTGFATGPAPPRLPPKEQEEFERLQRNSTGAFSTPRPSVTVNQRSLPSEAPAQSLPQINQSPASMTRTPPQINQSPASQSDTKASPVPADDIEIVAVNARVKATGEGEELHPDIRRGAKPEFEGDVNPVTGEVGGPKNEPLRWGSTGERGDWSYNGRVTDF